MTYSSIVEHKIQIIVEQNIVEHPNSRRLSHGPTFLHQILDLDLVNICSHTLIIDSRVKSDPK